jgi:hypothetical protein
VVEFSGDFETWVGSFASGGVWFDMVAGHPDGRLVVVVASGALWVVNPEDRTAERLSGVIKGAFPVENPVGWIFNREDLAFLRLAASGILWHTKRLSWDGFDQLRLENGVLTGLGFSPIDDRWRQFSVDAATGRSWGGGYLEPDAMKWEVLR